MRTKDMTQMKALQTFNTNLKNFNEIKKVFDCLRIAVLAAFASCSKNDDRDRARRIKSAWLPRMIYALPASLAVATRGRVDGRAQYFPIAARSDFRLRAENPRLSRCFRRFGSESTLPVE